MSDIAKAWTGIGEIKTAMTGLERRMNAYRKENTRRRTPSDPVLDVSSVLSDRSTTSVTVDNVPRYVLRGEEENNDRRTSSPLKQPSARSSTNLFSDVESVSTINSNTGRSAPRDPVKMQEGMMKLKEKIIRQKEMALSASNNNAEVRYLDPKNYDASKPAHSNNRDVRKRKKATAPISETYKGFNEAQKVPKPVRKHVSIAPALKYVPEQPRPAEPPRRKVAAAPQDKNAIITTSSWRQGAAITRKVLGNKTQETDTSSSSISASTDTSTKKDVAKPASTAAKPVTKPKPKKITPRREESPVVTKKPGVPRLGLGPKKKPVEEALPKVKARHYNPEEVQKYIEKTKKQRKKAEAEQKLKDAKAEKEKEARLQELFNFQNKGMKKRGSISRSTPSPTKLRSDSGESSDKENSFVSPPSPPTQDPGPGKLPEKVVSFITQPQPSEGDVTLEAEEPIVLQGENTEPSPDLLPSYLQKKASSDKVVYSEQRRRMEAIRATALALRKKIYDETNRLTEEASRANQLLRPLAGYEEYTAPDNTEVKEAWSEAKSNAEAIARNNAEAAEEVARESSSRDETLIEDEPDRESELMSTGDTLNSMNNTRNEWPLFEPPVIPAAAPEPFEFPLTADPYSIINIYARQRQREEERIVSERKREDEREEDAARDLRKEIEQLERDKKREERELAVMEAEVQREEERLGELRRRKEERSSLNKSISVGSIDSYCSEDERDTRNTESLLHTTTGSDSDTPEVHTDYNFTPEHSPLKDISLVSASSAKKSLSFSDHDSVLVTDNDSTLPIPAADNTGLYSPAALHRKLRGELARYDTYSLSLEHVNTLQHTQQHADAQQDTVAIASALRTEDTKHEAEMAQLQEKLRRDMAEFQEKLNQVQTQTVLQRADLMNQQAETHAKTAQSVLEATDKMANTHEETNRVLVGMAKKVTETQEAIQRNRLTSPDNTKTTTSAASYTPYTPTTAVPYTPSYATPYDTYTSVPQDVPETPTADRTLTTEKTLEQYEISESEDISPTKDISEDLLETPQRDKTDPLSAYTPQSQYDDEDVTESSPEKVQESFKALLPSESHRRRMSASEESTSSQPRQASDSFTTFTMSQVHEYIKNESVRAKHQDTLLALREKALKEKTDVKLKWLEIKKKRIQRKGADDKMPPLLQKEKDILAALASEQEEIKKLQEVQRAAQAERKRMVYQQREISAIQHRTAKLRKRIKTAEHSNEDMPSDISDMSMLHGGYDTDGSSVYDEDPRFKSLAEFNQRIQREGNEVKRLLDQALAEKKETEKIESEFGISPSRLPRGIKPLSNASSATSTLTRDTVKLVSPRSSFESSTPLREGSVPPSPAYSVIEGDRHVASEVLEMEERVNQLKEELAAKKAEARRLLKDEQQKKKEALRLQEQNLRKQISTVTNVIDKQKKQIHNKFRSPNSSPDKRHTTKRHSVKYSSDDSSVKSSVSEIKSDRSFDKSSEISEYVSKEDVPSKSEISSEIVSANFDITVSSSSNKEVSEEIKTKISERNISVRSETRSKVISENISSEKVSEKEDDVISEDLSKNSYADISFNKLQNVKIMELEEEISIGDKTEDKSQSHDESLGNVRSLNELETSDKAASESISSDKPSLFSLKDASALEDVASPDVTPPIAESPQPSLHISVDVLEDLSLSSGSLNDTDYSFKDIVKSETQSLHQQSISEKEKSFVSDRSGTGLISQKSRHISEKSRPISEEVLSKVTSYTDLYTKIEEDIVSEEISEVSEDISEEVISGTASIDGGAALTTPRDVSTAIKGSSKLQSARLLDMEIERSLSEVSSAHSHDKSVSEKLAELESRYSKVSERTSMKSYTLSFEDEDEKRTSSRMPDTMFTEDEEDLKSLLSNIDESLNKSSAILVKSAAVESPTKSPEGSPRGHTFSNLTALSSTTASTDTGDTTKLSEAPDALTPMLAPSPPARQPSPLDRLVAERSQSLRQTSFKMRSPDEDVESEVLEDLDLSIEAETADDVDDISLNQSLSDSKTMSELKGLCSPTPSNQTSKTLSHSESPVDQELLRPTIFSDANSEETLADDRSSTISEEDESYSKEASSTRHSQPSVLSQHSQPSVLSVKSVHSDPLISRMESIVLSDEEEHPDNVTESIFQEMIRAAFEKMLKVRQDKRQKQLNSSPKYMERSPPGAEKRQQDLTLNDTYPDTDLESALALARSVGVEEERSVMSPDLPPPPKVTVQCNQQDTLAMATAVTQHLIKCVRNKRPCTLDTFTHCQHLPPNLTPSEQIQARTFQSLIYKTTVECFAEVNNEYNFVSSAVQDLPPWRPETKRRPRPHWMRDLPPRLDLASVEHCLPGKVVSLVGLSDEPQHQRKYQHMENILTQEVRDEEAEWTDYDADELAVKFRLSDTIFECLLRETIAVYSAIDQREIGS